MKDILEGLREFERVTFPRHRQLFERLAQNQTPGALFITCSDSRVVPNLILDADPGELFIVRNAGNIVPPKGDGEGGTAASIEYAVQALGITDIVLCGHSDCGAMKGVLHPDKVVRMPSVASWVQHGAAARRAVERLYTGLDEHELLERMVEQNVIQQVKNLLTYPFIREKVEHGRMELYGWVYDIRTGAMRGLDERGESFTELTMDAAGSPDEKHLLRELDSEEKLLGRI